jgi:quercetin dioxygenase-like cupin family protein
MQPGTTAPEHWHSSAERMVLISGEMHVTYQGEDKNILTPGSYAFGPARKPHLAECVGEEPCVLFIAFVQPVDSYVEQ